MSFEGKPHIVTNNQKKVYQKMKKNGKVEIRRMHKGTWIRIYGEVTEDTRREACAAMMDGNLMTVFYIEHSTATVYSFTDEPKVYNI